MKKFSKKFLKIFLWVLGSLVGVFLLIILLIQIPAVQNYIKTEAVSFIEDKINTPVSIDRISIGLPKKIVINGVYFEDQQQDTLLAGERLAVDISMLKLLRSEVEINSVELEGILVNIKRNSDSVFNFDYIIEAFASEPQEEETGDGMKISVDDISLERIRFRLDDAVSKTDLDVQLQKFETGFDEFDLEEMRFGIPEILLDGLDVSMRQGLVEQTEEPLGTAEESAEAQEAADLNIDLGEIRLSRIKTDIRSETAKIDSKLQLDELLLRLNNLDLQRELAEVETFSVNGLNGALILLKEEAETEAAEIPEEQSETVETEESNWRVKLENTDLKGLAFRFKDENAPAVERGIDYMDLDISNLNLEAEDLYYSNDTISGNIASFTAQEKSGLDIQSLRTEFLYGNTSSYLRDLYIETPRTLIREEIVIGYPSIESLSERPGELEVNATITDSKIGFADILIFVPELRDTNPFKSSPNAIMQLKGNISGKLKDLNIKGLQVSGIGQTRVALGGNIRGLPDAETAYYDIDLDNFESTDKDVAMFLPEGTLPEDIQLPETFSATGFFRGRTDNFSTNLDLQSSMGVAQLEAAMDLREKDREKYDALIFVDDFNVGKLIQNDSLGSITLRAKAKGTGFDPATASATAEGTLVRAEFNDYIYEELNFEGSADNGIVQLNAGMEDPNLDFDLDANANFEGEYPAIALTANLRNIALDSLNLSQSVLRFRGDIVADFETADPDYLNGQAFISPFLIETPDGQFPLDSISLRANATDENQLLVLNSQFLDARIDGDYQLTKIGPALTRSISRYYDLNAVPDTVQIQPQQLVFEMQLKSDPLLDQLVPDLDLIRAVSLSGNFNSETDRINLQGEMPRLDYGEFEIRNANIDVSTEGDALSYSLIVDDVESPQIKLPHTELTGSVEDNMISYLLQVDDTEDKPHYRVAGTLETREDATIFSLNPDNLLLNYETWNIPEDNRIVIAEEGILADSFNLSHEENTLRINSLRDEPGAPLEVVFEQFQLETISSMISKDTLLAGGQLNGEAVLRNLTTSPEFNSDLTIEDFSFRRDTVGNLNLIARTREENIINAQLEITGQDNLVNLAGDFNTAESSLDFKLDIDRLHLKSIQGFTMGNLKESTGYISGDLDITGSLDQLLLTGEMKFNEVAFRVTPLDAYFQSMNDRIVFDEEGLSFSKFSLSDVDENQLVLDGRVNTTNYQEFGFDFTVNSTNFKAISSTAESGEYFYGDLFLDTNLQVGGTLESPSVDGNVTIKEGTDLTIVLPQPDPSIADREGVVEFVTEENRLRRERQEIEKMVSTADIPSMNVSVNVESEKEARFVVIVDEANGDNLSLQGVARINAGIDPSGKVTLTGRYEFTQGAYAMSFNFIKRRFDIEAGSYILWTGDPTAATVNINAIYETETAPIDLLENQLSGLTGPARNIYKQRLPFQTILQIRGELMDPEIGFDIRLPEGNYTVASDVLSNTRTKLTQLRQQPSQQNKQVFSLLLLNRFMGEDPFASEAGGGGAEMLARQSVSRILSQQLNKLASDLISGVQLEFDLESQEDYTTGEQTTRTDLNVQVSKQLLNERLKVTVGSSFEVEGSERTNEEANQIAGDIAVDYFLSKDGRYILRAYRKNQYEVALQGQVVETGVAFIITLDYDKFMEIFSKQKDDQ